MKNKELFEQAIADAKAVRDTAVANAKLALEETLAPRIMSMIQTKLSEMEEDVEESEKMMKDEAYEKEEEGKMMKDEAEMKDEAYELEEDDDDYRLDTMEEADETDESYMEEGDITESDLEEILAELEAEALEERKKKAKPEPEEKEEEDEKEDEKEKMDEGLDEMEDEVEETEKISVDELRNIIRDVFMNEMGMKDTEESVEEDFNLEEILAELDEAEDEEEKKMEEAKKKAKEEEDDKEKEEMKEELKEAIATINTLKSELNEVNLLNAKLLYMNKIFKSKNLSEGQKLKVINALDRAANLNEAKNIYETLKDALVETKKSTIKESVGFASKPMGIAPAKTIVNEDVQVTRMKKLAGIIK